MSVNNSLQDGSYLQLMEAGDRAFLELSVLKQREALLQTRLLQRNQGLKHWKLVQAKQSQEMEALTKRIDELCRVLRSRDEVIDRLEYTKADYAHQIKVLEVKLQNRKQGLHGLPERKLNLPRAVACNRTATKLPTSYQATQEHKKGQETNVEKLPVINGYPCAERGGQRVRECERVTESTQSSLLEKSALTLMKAKQCVSVDQWVASDGGQIELPGLCITFHANTVYESVMVSLTQYPKDPVLQACLRKTGFSRYLDACMTFGLQPYCHPLLRPLTVTLKDARPSGQGRFFIFTKEVDHHYSTEWCNSTDKCRPKVKQDYVTFPLGSPCLVTVVRVTMPLCGLKAGVTYSQGVGLCKQLVHTNIKSQALSLMNNKCTPAVISLYVNVNNSKVMMVITTVKPEISTNQEESDIRLLSCDNTLYEICEGEILFPYVDEKPLWNQELVVNVEQIQDSGQYSELSISDFMNSTSQKSSYQIQLKRNIADTDILVLCTLSIPRMVDSCWVDHHGYSALQVLEVFQERILKCVDVRFLLNKLCEDLVFSKLEIFRISHEKDRNRRQKLFLDELRCKGEEAILSFHKALESEYPELAEEMSVLIRPLFNKSN